MDCQNKKMELETSVTELERTAQQQMRSLAHHSEQAIEAAQDKLKLTYNQLQQYQQFIKVKSDIKINLSHPLKIYLSHLMKINLN